MKSFSFAKALTLSALVCFSLPVACGDDDDDTTPNPPVGGAGGEPATPAGGTSEGGAGGAAPAPLPDGLSYTPSTLACGAEMCQSANVLGQVYIDPCCATDGCGLDTGFLDLVGAKFEEKCQPKGQVGEPDTSCPTTAPSTIPFNGIMVPINGFAGCCRDNGMCGVAVDDVISPALGKVVSLGLGCVDSAPFFPDATVAACGSGTGGAGGMSAGGAGGVSTGGAGDVGGAGGNQ